MKNTLSDRGSINWYRNLNSTECSVIARSQNFRHWKFVSYSIVRVRVFLASRKLFFLSPLRAVLSAIHRVCIPKTQVWARCSQTSWMVSIYIITLHAHRVYNSGALDSSNCNLKKPLTNSDCTATSCLLLSVGLKDDRKRQPHSFFRFSLSLSLLCRSTHIGQAQRDLLANRNTDGTAPAFRKPLTSLGLRTQYWLWQS